MILITGASTGIGFETALSLYKKGYVVCAGVRKAEDAQRLKEAAGEKATDQQRMHPMIIDVTNEEHLKKAYAEVEAIGQKTKRHLQGVINNAGVVVTGPLEFIDMDKYRQQFEVNTFAPLRVTQVFLPLLRKAPILPVAPKIINISSIAGRTVTPYMSPYCGSKYALEVWSESLSMELAPWGIQVCLIEPGSIATPIWQKSADVAKKSQSDLPALAEEYYGEHLESFQTLARISAKKAIPVQNVVDAIICTLESKNPKARQLVGRDAKIAMLQNLFPDKIRRKMVLKVLNKFKPRTKNQTQQSN